MDTVRGAIEQAAHASTLRELAEQAFPLFARALHACPAFFAQVSENFWSTSALAGEHAGSFGEYVRDYVPDDPVALAALATGDSIVVPARGIERRVFHASRAYTDFHRPRDMEHHLSLRVGKQRIVEPGAIVLGFGRGRRQQPFGAREVRIARLVLPAFRGTAQRVAHAGGSAASGPHGFQARAAGKGLSPAESNVLAALALGLSNAEIGRRLFISIPTVKTHLYMAYRKLGVRCRTHALAVLRDEG